SSFLTMFSSGLGTLLSCCVLVLVTGSPTTRPRLRDGQRIVGGQDATKGQFPYQISFQEKILGFQAHFCGGTIISPTHVVTAAHCVEGGDMTDPRSLLVVAGEHNLDINDGDEQTIHLEFIIEHPFYDVISFVNDIAILKLAEPLVFNDFVGPITLPEVNQTFDGEMCRVSGWGNMKQGSHPASILQFVDVPNIPDDTCNQYFEHDELFDSMVCAGYDEGGMGSCQGDSGGPLVCSGVLAGVVSWGYGCAQPKNPSVYTEVSYFVEWINAHI
ncbi:unnamed protein product, partial [Meganyctiphanes norvegica]